MKQVLALSILCVLVLAQNYSITECSCNQLQSEKDCQTNNNCSWDSSKKICNIMTNENPKSYTQYCDNFNEIDCANTNGCAWNGNKCSFFTGCTAYVKTTDQDCKKISNKCITDGTHCVELGNCNSYLKQTSCIKNTTGAFCYWDNVNQVCSDANSCDKLPNTLQNDQDCRQQISTCTTKLGGGCIESGLTCNDQQSEIQCITNKDRTQQCFWNGNKCVDRICDNAPLTYTTDDQCKQYNQNCTTKQNGGCIQRTTCQAATNSASCVTNQQGQQCYWNGNACVDKICSNAPQTMTTNSACQGFLNTCITTGNGCITNGQCNVAKIDSACKKNINGQDCIWVNNTCKEKTCDNAPTTLITHNDCNSYLSSCTVKSNNQGCQIKTCNNAPLTLITNQDCENYLPNSNCITKLNGGCTINTTCSAINIDKACIKDIQGKQCFWDNNVCKEKTCQNAPNTLTDHQQCQNYLNICTVNSTNNGCIEKTCENSLMADICNIDYNNKACIYKGKCYQKQCSYASQSYTTHNECNNYLSNCTLHNNGYGCMEIPLKCEAITNKNSCYLKKIQDGYLECGWDGQYCIDKGCTTIDKSINTTIQCNQQINGCVSANPINNIVNGCMDLPNTCQGRKSEDNCLVDGQIKCIWNSITKTCIDKTCSTANIDGTTNKLNIFNTQNCNTYLNGCLMNNTQDGCISKVTNCSQLTQSDNCITNSKINGQCYWNGNTCVDLICSNLLGNNHNECNNLLNTCTYKQGGGCQQLNKCDSYQIKEQCIIDSNNNSCTWSNNQCRNTICTDAPNTNNYQTDSGCLNFNVLNDKCTIISRVNNVGCAPRQQECQYYIDQQQCQLDNSNNECLWHNNQCWKKSIFTCSNITLNQYTNQNCENILYSCKANGNTCVNKECIDYLNTNGLTTGTAITTNEECKSLNNTCTLKNSSTKTCQLRLSTCTQYGTDSESCTISDEGNCIFDGTNCVASTTSCTNFTGTDDSECSTFREFCKYPLSGSGSQQCISKTCEDKTGANLTYEICQEYDLSCSVKSDGSGCITKQSTCSGYGTTTINCYKSDQGYCVIDTLNSNNCIASTSTNCNLITGNNLTDQQCSQINNSCIANRDGTKCQIKQQNCTDITQIDNCTRSNQGECISSLSDNTNGARCIAVTQTIQCTSIYLGTGNYTDQNCYKKNSKCTNNNTNNGCQDRTCSNKQSPTNFDDCNQWLNSCTYNNSNQCVTISQTCLQQSTTNCYRAIEGDCIVIGTQCVKKTCENAPTNSNTNHGQCSNYLSTCTVARLGGCISRQSQCSLYKTQLQCTKNSVGNNCYWSTQNNNCVDLTCNNIDQSSQYNTHNSCQNQLSSCTVRAQNQQITQGCISKGQCSSYTIEEQCQVDMNGGQCQWISSSSTCVDRNCQTAPSTINTHSDCENYYKVNNKSICTVNVNIDQNGITQLSGCQILSDCKSYIDKEQCIVNNNGGRCEWNDNGCDDYSCLTAPKTDLYNTQSECNDYKSECTVDNSGIGCMELKETCEQYQISDNCISNKNGNKCYWDTQTNSCITRTCENAPNDTQDDIGCNNYLQGCTMDQVKCKLKVCEDFKFNTDIQCTQAMSSCTTDGIKCITRGTCYQALNEAGCIKDINNKQCQWIQQTDTQQGYCTLKQCSTAPIDKYTTEQQCQGYYTNCTTKKGGGCITKSTCAAANIEQACTTALDGTNCQWDNGKCRNKDCQDYNGKSHSECQSINSNCTIGLNGKCTRIKSCSNTTLRDACIYGLDGPCLWIEQYINQDNSKGACFPYTSCNSLNWNNDQSCKLISNQCTTNGTNCVSITQCSETNINGGCVTGTDGECIQSITKLNSNDPPKCKIYTTCQDAYYTTHQECQNANNKCTTNGTTGCIPLSTCQSYNMQGCIKNLQGQIINSGLITSTGYCTWDNTKNECRDQICEDLNGITHDLCYTQLSTCTTDGTKCITKNKCSLYTQNACNNALGTDGICILDTTTQQCRIKQCSDIQNGTTHEICNSQLSFCISDGKQCIPKDNCSNYTTKTACNYGGLNGACVFTQSNTSQDIGTCQLMTSCSVANNDQIACESAKQKCSWTPASNNTQSKCTSHTCATYLQTNNVCTNFKSWNNQYQQICKLISGTCKEIDPTQLNESECYTITNYSYTWNQSISKCSVCQSPITPNNSNNSNSTNNNSTITDSGILLSVSIILSYLII